MSPTRRASVSGVMPSASRDSAVILLAATGCGAPQQMFSDATDGAARVTTLTWFMIIVAAIVYVVVIALMLAGMWRNRQRDPHAVDLSRPGIRWVVIGGGIMPAVVLTAVFLVALTAMGRYPGGRPARGPARDAVTTVDVTANQWWWQVKYAFPDLTRSFTTANEIHVPVGEPVLLRMHTADVIHSFWVPRLQGKIDMIPGQQNEMRLVAREPGVYPGQCAEFCGAQHAKMKMVIVADPPAQFRQWVQRQLAPAATPTDSLTVLGQRLFVAGPCSTCHTVRGTPALGQVAPDLTHMGSRLTIAAGWLPNSPGNLEAWIANAQSIKPGNRMPTLSVYSGRELRAVAAYVASLK